MGAKCEQLVYGVLVPNDVEFLQGSGIGVAGQRGNTASENAVKRRSRAIAAVWSKRVTNAAFAGELALTQ